MKRIEYTSNLVRTFLAVAFAGMMSACTLEHLEQGVDLGTDGGLAINSTVSDAVVATKAESVEALKEKQLNTLDVFVEDVAAPGTFIKQYHLPYSGGQAVQEKVNNWLADNWKGEGLVVGKNYNIYVATNNTKTKANVASVADLKALTYSEVEEEIAVIKDGNIDWNGNSTSGNIYKLYDANPGDARALTSEKEFMMDGVIKNWTPDPNTRDQVFPVTINRAAAKFVLNVKFDADFLKSLTQEKKTVEGQETWVDKPVAEQVTITGSPAWKFYNFAFGAPVFAPDTQGQGVEVHNSNFNIFHNQEYAGDDKHFTITTYSYPNKWASADYATAAPSMVISVGYLDNGATDPNYHYYRIPLVKSTVTEIMRNHIYVVNATIATRGSAAQEDQDVTEDINYAVLPWNDQSNSDVIENHVESVQHYYFNVNPKVYTLRGDGDQSVVLNYSKASGTKVGWKLFTYDDDGNQLEVVESDNEDAIRAWFYNANGDFTTSYNDNSGIDWSDMGVNIQQSTEGTSGSKGTVTVTSSALNNKAIKYIRLRVYLDETNEEGDSLEETYHEDIIIRHFPTDNIQSITGSWSSYSPSGSTQTITLTTTSLSEAEAWAEQYGVNYTSEDISSTDYITYSEYLSHAGEDGYVMNGPNTSSYNAFHNAIQSQDNRQAANSQANAIPDGGEGHTYYWGTGVTMVQENSRNYNGQYDYRVVNHYGMFNTYYDYYKYSNYYSASYTHSYSYTQYSLTVEMASTGNWVDWERDANKTYSGNNRKINANGNFFAKVYDNGNIKAVVVNQNGNDKTYSLKYGNNYDYYYYWNGTSTQSQRTYFNHTNNHMYVVQISSTSDEYVLGRPVKGNPSASQSYDNVVSPAFMIASQLGAVTQFTGNNAATNAADHCDQYMEVASDGTRYTGWRLPTQSEIGVISRYQSGVINNVEIPTAYQTMSVVLGGDLYWCLSGRRIRTSDNQVVNQGNAYLRCVRDLSAAEVDALNGFDKIQEKYRTSGN